MMGIMVPADPSTADLKQIQERTMLFTEQNMEASFVLGSELAKAKNFKEMLEIQSRHAQRQTVTYATQQRSSKSCVGSSGAELLPMSD